MAILLLTVIWVAYAWRAIDETVNRDMRLIAERTAGEIEEYLSGRVETVIGMKELLSYPDEDRFKLALMLKRIEVEFNQFRNISIFDASNKTVASSRSDSPGSIPGEILGIVKGGKVYRSPLLFTGDNLPYLKIAVPLFWQGEVYRILLTDIDVTEVWNKVDGIKIGTTGRASIISKDGVYLADADKSRVLKQQKLTESLFLEKELSGNEAEMDVQHRDGRSLTLAFAEIPSTGWKLIVMQDHWESMHFLFVMAYQAAFVILAAFVIAYYASTHISRKFSQPVEELHKGIEEIAKNNFGYKIPELYGDELSALGKGINIMAISLAEKEEAENRLVEVERMAALGKLAGSVAHEINNPLAIMKNYIFVMSKNKMAEEDPNQKYLKIIDGEIERVAKIIRDFNDFYKGVMVAELEEFDISAPLKEVLAFCKVDLATRGITVEERVDESGKVMADKDKLKQVFLNLIKNAGEAMPNGGRVTVETRKENGRIYVFVTDTGMGIKPEHTGKVFEPFFTTKGVKGFGLGLTVTYGIIKSFGGDIEVESEAGKGTTFKVMLPISSD
jgi:signal transduction histidine kinase